MIDSKGFQGRSAFNTSDFSANHQRVSCVRPVMLLGKLRDGIFQAFQDDQAKVSMFLNFGFASFENLIEQRKLP